jgi:transcription termination/antitermination protein NusA
VAKALSPARVREVYVDDDNRQATVVVPDDQLSLAIGREGQNARLAARLTGWRVDIKSEQEFASEEAEGGYGEEEELGGRCAAILTSGRRCPNAALPGSRYCGLEAHQALAGVDGDEVALITGAATATAEAEPADALAAEDTAGDEPTEPEPQEEPLPADEITPEAEDEAAEAVAESEATLEEAEGEPPADKAPAVEEPSVGPAAADGGDPAPAEQPAEAGDT